VATQKKIVLTAEDQTKGAFRSAQRNMGKLESATAGLQKAFAVLAGAYGLQLVARSFINAADKATQLENKLKLVTDTSKDLTRVYGKLFKISKDTRVSFESTSALYARLARSSDQLGLSEQELYQITTSLNQAFAVSGAGIQETSSAVLQLGQGLASGRLQGDELRSIMENAPRVAKMIADGMGIHIGQLRQLGSEGKLNAESVTQAILKMGYEVKAEFEKTSGTVAQASQSMGDSWMNFVNVVDESTGATGGLSSGLNFFSQTLDNLATSVKDLSDPASAGLEGLAKPGLRKELQNVWYQLQDTAIALNDINTAFDKGEISINDAFRKTLELNRLYVTRNNLQARHSEINKRILQLDIAGPYEEATKEIAKYWVLGADGITKIGVANEEWAESVGLVVDEEMLLTKELADQLTFAIANARAHEAIAKYKQEARLAEASKTASALAEETLALNLLSEARIKALGIWKSQQEEIALKTETERRALQDIVNLENAVTRDLDDRLALMAEQKALKDESATWNVELTGFKKELKGIEDLKNARLERIEKAYGAETLLHDEMLRQKLSAEEAYNTARNDLIRQEVASVVGGLASQASAVKDQSRDLFETWQAMSVVQSTMNAYESFTKTMAAYPYPWNVIAATASLALTMAYVNKISTMQYPGREKGGSVMGGKSYIVGEAGPELFTPGRTGGITPNNKLRGTTNVNFQINTVDASSFDVLLNSRRGMIVNMINQAMNRQGRVGLT
jgi:tape measure domain-containing protein